MTMYRSEVTRFQIEFEYLAKCPPIKQKINKNCFTIQNCAFSTNQKYLTSRYRTTSRNDARCARRSFLARYF